MVTLEEVSRVASVLPGTIRGGDGLSFGVEARGKVKGFIWVWNERVEPKKPKVPNPGVLAFVVRNLGVKEVVLSSGLAAFVHDPHYDNYPAVLVRLSDLAPEELEDLVLEAWRTKAPAALQKAYDANRPDAP